MTNMFLPIYVAFELLFIVPQTTQNQDMVLRDVIIDNKVVGVLGEDVYLHCLYAGKHSISDSSWKRLDSGNRAKMMAGYKNGKLFAKDNFSTPASHTNLTVKVHINSLEVEGKYTCVFSTDEEEMMESLFLQVVARPLVNSHADEEILNGTHYQRIFCSASYAKPEASLHWDIRGAPPSENIFSIINTNYTLPNGTVSIASMLRFPIHLNNESSVACVIQHSTLTEPSTTVIDLQSFVFPNITMDMTLIEKEGDDFLEVSCRAKGGRPHPSITWIDPEMETTSCSTRFINYESVSCSRCFPLADYEGKNISCIFGYPHLPAIEKTVTLPTYYLTSLQLRNISIKMDPLNNSNLLILEEGDSDIKIILEVLGNVPRYKINCTKDGEPLSEDVNVVVSGLTIKGPVGTNQTGQYQCQASYYRHTASLKFELKVKPMVQLPAPINVTLHSNTSWENGIEYIVVKCLAENVSPSANITWETRECRGEISKSVPENVQSGSQQYHSGVWNSARLPVYSYAGCTLNCVVHHHGLKEPLQKSIHIPITASPRIDVSVGLLTDSTHWSAVCKADGAITNISWFISDTDTTALHSTMNFTREGSKELTSCIYKFKQCQHEGKFLTCAIQNKYGDLERRTIHVPHFFISSVMVLNKTVPLHGSHKQHTGLHRVALKEHVSNQKIFFQVNGNASKFNFKCIRSDGLSAHTTGMALIFTQQVSESDAGLYTCSASWCHHNASVMILVEVTSQKIHSMMLILICFSSAVAITIIMMVTVCIFCKRNEETHSSNKDWKKRDSLAALMQDPRSPELKKTKGQHQEYAELVHYSIVIDVKSTV